MCPAGDPINQGQVEWSFPDPRIAQLDAAVADYKAAWERDVRLNAELRAKQEADLAAMRRLLWLRHGCPITSLYGDDGEMQCRQCRIDFLRATPEVIGQTFEKMGREALTTPTNQQDTKEAP